MDKKRKKITITLSGSVFALLLLTGLFIYRQLFTGHLQLTNTAYIHIDRDDTPDSVRCKLEACIHPANMRGFDWLVSFKGYHRVYTGCYAIHPQDNMADLYLRLSRGWQSPVKLSFHNLRTRTQLAARLAEQLMIDSAEIATRLYDPDYCRQLGYTPDNIVSLFLPNTYEVYWNISADELFKRMGKEHDSFWTQARKDRAQAIGLTPDEVSTLASIVEEETNDKAEMPVVAGLYLNRLRKGMPLQADPTVKFAMQDFTLRRILTKHLLTESPYNTYKHPGLPPGPIRIPSVAGLESVLNYTRHHYLYMCAKEDFSGTHNFARTLAEHQRNAQRYRQALNKRKIF